jgi:hypothetical protein
VLLLHVSEPRRRRAVAAGLEHAVRRAGEPRARLTAEVPVDREAIAEQAGRLLDLAEILRSDRELPAGGVAEARRLVTDGGSPLFVEGDRLPYALTRVELALGL